LSRSSAANRRPWRRLGLPKFEPASGHFRVDDKDGAGAGSAKIPLSPLQPTRSLRGHLPLGCLDPPALLRADFMTSGLLPDGGILQDLRDAGVDVVGALVMVAGEWNRPADAGDGEPNGRKSSR
jgi:hypothetical protein